MIGRLARRVKRECAAAHILGYTCVNDVTAGELRKTVGTPMMFHAKAFNTLHRSVPWSSPISIRKTSTPNAASTDKCE